MYFITSKKANIINDKVSFVFLPGNSISNYKYSDILVIVNAKWTK